MRTFLPWQMWRFAAINVKMIGIIRRSHHGDSPKETLWGRPNTAHHEPGMARRNVYHRPLARAWAR
jgi:hypothetical protein